MRHLLFRGLLLSATLATTSLAFAQTAGQDMKDAGHDTAHATKRVGHATAHGTKKAYHKTAHGTGVAAHKTEDAGKDVGHDTKVGAEKTGHGIHNLGRKIEGKPTN